MEENDGTSHVKSPSEEVLIKVRIHTYIQYTTHIQVHTYMYVHAHTLLSSVGACVGEYVS